MELVREEITNHKNSIEGLEGYLLLVQKAEEHVTKNPDIAIEACKSLIEGLCLKALSLVNDEFQSSKSLQKKCKNDLSFLTNYTFDKVYTNFVETKIHQSLSTLLIDVGKLTKFQIRAGSALKSQAQDLVSKISGLRNERGDISHGKIYPKKFESSPVLAKSILSIADGVCSFMIHELASLYSIQLADKEKLKFQDLTEFNLWVNETHQVTSLKIDFSKILYEHAYEKYEELYYGEYLEREEIVEYFAEWSNPVKVVTPEESTVNEVNKGRDESKFDQEEFWSFDRWELLHSQAAELRLDAGKLIEILNDMYFSDRAPLHQDVADALLEKPKLLERTRIINEKIQEIEHLAKILIDLP